VEASTIMRAMPLRLFQIDAFTDRPFAGNQAAVCVLDEPAPAAWMQAMAAETDLPATAFVVPPAAPDGEWSLRWFTAARELALCGHATLATSHVLLHELGVAGDVIRYATVAGTLTARSAGDGLVELDLPAHPATPSPADAGAVLAALYADGSAPAGDTFRGFEDLLVVVPSPDDVRRLVIDTDALATIPARCIIVSAAVDPTGSGGDDADVDIVCRVFAPSVGVGEDPVTGSAHCLLGPYWADRLGIPTVRSHQASARGGHLRVEVRGDRVALHGRAVTVLRAELADAAVPDRGVS
jgi:PhzF family phenazine biosynthesis protein